MNTSDQEATTSAGAAPTLQQTLAIIERVTAVPASMGTEKVLLKVRRVQGDVQAGAAHLVNGRGESRPVTVLGITLVEPLSAADIEEGVFFIRVRGTTADEASRYPWLVQE